MPLHPHREATLATFPNYNPQKVEKARRIHCLPRSTQDLDTVSRLETVRPMDTDYTTKCLLFQSIRASPALAPSAPTSRAPSTTTPPAPRKAASPTDSL